MWRDVPYFWQMVKIDSAKPNIDFDTTYTMELVQSYVNQFLTFGLSSIGAGLKNSW